MQSLLKLLAHIAKAFGISSPSDNARVPISWKQKQRMSASPDLQKPPLDDQH